MTTAPRTDYDSKTVMLRAERRDRIEVVDVVEHHADDLPVPDVVWVVQRQHTYFGPLLLVAPPDGRPRHRVTAPGPDRHLLFWSKQTVDGSEQWARVAEVRVAFAGEQPDYNICPGCGQPIRTAEHERLARLDTCTGFG